MCGGGGEGGVCHSHTFTIHGVMLEHLIVVPANCNVCETHPFCLRVCVLEGWGRGVCVYWGKEGSVIPTPSPSTVACWNS